jgi:hypothetical protein
MEINALFAGAHWILLIESQVRFCIPLLLLVRNSFPTIKNNKIDFTLILYFTTLVLYQGRFPFLPHRIF